MKLLRVVAIFCFLIATISAKAQYKKRDWHLYAGPSVGTMYYVGELKRNSLPAAGYMHASIGFRGMMQLKRLLAIQASYTYGGLSGYDSLVNPVLVNRGFSFTTRTHDLELLFKLTLLNQNKRITRATKFVAYPKLVAGIGSLNFKPMREYNGEKIDLRSLGTGGQTISGGAYPEPYGMWALGIKLGGELSIYTGPKTTIDFYGYYTFAQTDYLDDVGGGKYIEVTDIQSADNPELLAALAYAKVYNSAVPKATPGHSRGNPDTKDGYFNFGFAVSYRLTELAKGNRSNSLPFISRMRF